MRLLSVVSCLAAWTGCALFGSNPGDSDADTEVVGTDVDDPDTDPVDIEPGDCRTVNLVPDALPNISEGPGFGGDLEAGGEGLLFVINDETPGTFDLQCEEVNPIFCDRAVVLFQGDVWYVGFRGQIEILEAQGDALLSLRLIDAEFRETDEFALIPDGDCVAATEELVFSTESFVRLPSDCLPLQVERNSARLDGLLPGFFSADVTDPAGEIDEIHLEFFSSQTGLFDLSNNDNANYSSCEQCISVVGDGLRAFQSRGVANVRTDPSGTTLDVQLTNIELTEITLGAGSVSTPVPGGRCWSVQNPLSVYVD